MEILPQIDTENLLLMGRRKGRERLQDDGNIDTIEFNCRESILEGHVQVYRYRLVFSLEILGRLIIRRGGP